MPQSAIFVGAGHPLRIEDRPLPVPAAGQALIRVERCGICGSDLHMTSGSPFDVPHGTALGHEYAGEVVDIGPGEARLRVGDRVTALPMSSCGQCDACQADAPLHCAELRSMAGGYGEYTLIDERMAMRLPASLSFADGALVEPLASGLRGVRKLEMPRGARIAVIGAGAIGAAAIFWARQRSAGPIAAIARSRRAEALVGAVGGDALVQTGDELGSRLRAALGGAPDIVIEAAGAPGMMQLAVELVRTGGSILSLGGCVVPDPIVPAVAMVKELRCFFSVAYGRSEFREALETLEAGEVSPRAMVGDTISLEALPARFEAMRRGSHPAKVMVAPQSP